MLFYLYLLILNKFHTCYVAIVDCAKYLWAEPFSGHQALKG